MTRELVASISGNFKAEFEAHKLFFKQPSGTSRGILTEKKLWLIRLQDKSNPAIIGLGECSVISGLSPDYIDDLNYEKLLHKVCLDPLHYLQQHSLLDSFPSIRFGLESAFLDWKNGGNRIYFDNDFSKGKTRIPINGLIWMGKPDFMQEQIEEKLNQGFRCLKMKVGAIQFEEELNILRNLRKQFTKEELTLRVDANGAFDTITALHKLKQLAELDLHSIEQPIAVGQHPIMKELCANSPLPIALDEELIGIIGIDKKRELLKYIRPPYIILKPSLHGGISGTEEWISIAESLHIPWWMTSALESNVGLTTIAQLCGNYSISLPQGLGTGALYTSNFPSNLKIENGEIFQNLTKE